MQHRSIWRILLLIGACLTATGARADDGTVCDGRTSLGTEERIQACTRLIASRKTSKHNRIAAYHNRGNLFTTIGNLDRAVSDYSEAIKINPKLKETYRNRCIAHHRRGDYDHAISDCSEAIRLDPRDARIYNDRSNIYHDKGEFDHSIADLDAAIKFDPTYVFAYRNRAIRYLEKKEYDRAITDLNQAIQIDSGYAAAYVNRGQAFEAKGDRDQALASFRSALSAPQKYDNGKWAHDTARERIAALTPKLNIKEVSRPPAVAAPQIVPTIVTGRRVSLVVGNAAYSNFPKVPNARNDAEDLAEVLKVLDFGVLAGTDLNRAAMEDVLITFARKAKESDTALIFYAGHGIQHNGINYLLPVDASLTDESDLRKLINLQDVINDLKGAGRVRILIVDACRDNDIVQQLASRLPSSRSAAFARGLARIQEADGTLVAFATQPNRVAADGTERNSPFTHALLRHLPTPGLELRTLMTRVRADVVNATGGAQRPEVWDSLVGEFAFKTGP
jgi:lipoprotein NlpI